VPAPSEPAGRAARPGLAVGAADSGFFAPSATALAASVGGVEVLRATASGGVTLGAAPGGHALEVATPASAVNRVVVNGAAAGSAVSVQAQGADANVGLALTPRGSGALSAHTPDGLASGGNARGANAVDWQTARAAAAQVGSGNRCVVGGGQNNTAVGSYSTVGGGDTNVAQSTGATVAGGRGNVASGTDAWVPGGLQATTRNATGKGAWASGQFASPGDAQSGEQVLRRQTTDATPTRLTADNGAPGASNTVNLPNNAAFACRIMVVAKEVGGAAGAKAMWDFVALARRDAAAVATNVSSSPGNGAAQAPTLAAGTGANAWTVTVGADQTNGGVAVTVVGAAGANINWVARILSAEAMG
jgi:hypothetical protein